ncbi:hypothetical protein GCM10017559_09210 [Streptosporangium longisporum]|uniref:Uncharacterized protein n=1 Tax=Streptosporangium longisporum TaxID=46187 RepID=A0ABN3XRV5_9ACTN
MEIDPSIPGTAKGGPGPSRIGARAPGQGPARSRDRVAARPGTDPVARPYADGHLTGLVSEWFINGFLVENSLLMYFISRLVI